MAIGVRILSLSLFLFLAACTLGESGRPSFLIVAVESMPFDAVICSEGQERDEDSAFNTLCNDFVRFTHAYTTSTLSGPALSSVLTGMYPVETQFRDNGSFLSNKFLTAPEVAAQARYKTSFFSGGIPILRKLGLGQGFEVFDDFVSLKSQLIFRPVEKSVGAFKEWFLDEVKEKDFFATFYLNDLLFLNHPTSTNLGQAREKSYAGQIDEIGESLGGLFLFLKEKRRWDNTHVIIFGLNGRTGQERRLTLKPNNVYNENTQVALFIKPAGKKRDLGVNWKIDENVSLVDVGFSLMKYLGASVESSLRGGPFEKVLLDSAFSSGNTAISRERPLLVESAWAKWRSGGAIRAAVLKENHLFVNDMGMKIFNNLIDRLQGVPVGGDDGSVARNAVQIKNSLENLKFEKWHENRGDLVDELSVIKEIAGQKWTTESAGIKISVWLEREKISDLLLKFMARLALQTENWKLLKAIGLKKNNGDILYIAEKNLNEKTKQHGDSGCFDVKDSVTLENMGTLFKKCPNFTTLKLLAWIQSENKKPQLKEVFMKAFLSDFIDHQVLEANFLNDLIFDLPTNSESIFSATDLILALPENKSYNDTVKAFMKEMDETF